MKEISRSLTKHLDKEQEVGNNIQISERESSEIRWAIISYLNRLETTLTAVRHNVADEQMIYEQYKYLVSPEEGHSLLENFRKAAGGSESYPAIEEFANKLIKAHSHVSPGKTIIA